MMKNEYVFTIMVGEPKIGEGIVLKKRRHRGGGTWMSITNG